MQSGVKVHFWLPVEIFFGSGDVGAAPLGVVFDLGQMFDFAAPAHEPFNNGGEF